MSQKIYLITKGKYSGHQRTLGFFMYLNNDFYYDIASIDGSHNSYHKDGSQWRTSLATGKRPTKDGQHQPLSNFEGHYNLGVVCLSKNIIPKLSKVKKKYFKKHITYEIDIESYPSDHINIVLELLEANKDLPFSDVEQKLPDNAVSTTVKERTPWLIFTILGHENLLIEPTETGYIANHFNERFTVNKKGQQYGSENYSHRVFDEHSKEI